MQGKGGQGRLQEYLSRPLSRSYNKFLIPKTIFLTGYYGFGNAGDEAILSTILRDLRGLRPGVRVVVASGDPSGTAARHNVECVSWQNLSGLEQAARRSDLVILGGGGLFHDYWGFNPDALLTPRHFGIAYWAAPALLAALLEKPLMLYAVGVGPLISEHGRRFTRVIAEAAAAITVRDAGSRRVLESIGVEAGRITEAADPTLGMKLVPGKRAEGGEKRLAVVLRHWDVGVYPEFWEKEVAAGLDLFLEAAGGRVVFVPFQALSGERENDAAVAGRVRAAMKSGSRAEIVSTDSVEELCELVSGCDAVLGMRLHALIFGFQAGLPLVGLAYDPKVGEMMAAAGLDGFVLDLKAVEADVLAGKLREALASADGFGAPLEGRREELAALAAKSVELAADLLEHPEGRAARVSPAMVPLLARAVRALVEEARELETARTAVSGRVEELETFIEQQKQAVEHAADESVWLRRLAQETDDLKQQLQERWQEMGRLAEDNRQLGGKAEELKVRSLAMEELAVRTEAALESERSRLNGELEKLRARCLAAESERDELRRQVDKAERLRGTMLANLDRFRRRMEGGLATYRSQRAWQAMLFVRQAYTLLVRRGWSGRLGFLPWLLGVPFRGAAALREQELVFPAIENFVAPEFEAPLAGAPRAMEPAGPVAPALPGWRFQQKYDVVILAIIDFDFRFQRPQQLAAQFARNGHRVFWVSPTRFLEPSSSRAYEATLLRDGIWEIHLRGPQPDIYMGRLEDEAAAALLASLKQVYGDWGISESAVLLQLPFWRKLGLAVRQECGSRLVYDCMDDWETFENMGRFNVSEEKRLVGEADLLIVTGQQLAERFTALGLKPLLARNGADYDFFAQAGPNKLLEGVARPIVGYFGAIADWIDLDLVEAVAKARPQYSFVLIGQVFGRDVTGLEALGNVRLPGNKAYEQIPSFLYHFDVCTIPFLLNQVTKATDPVKLYEYFSLGKPVVATDMAELGQCGDLLYIGRGAEDFAAKIDQALAERDGRLRERRVEFARANTWARRVEAIDGAVGGLFPLVSIVIVSYNSAEFLKPCLESIRRNTSYPAYEAVIVDNGSTDGGAETAAQFAAGDTRLRLLRLERNTGFAAGNNIGIRETRGEYLILLNVDTMVTPGWVERLISHLRRDPRLGLICPVTNFAGNEAKINVRYSTWREMELFSHELAAKNRGETMKIAVAPLFCAALSRRTWERVGELDEGFQVGMFEDDDFSLRIREAGLEVAAAEDCFVHHFGQGSFAKLPSEQYDKVFAKNRQRFEEKWRRAWTPHSTRPGVKRPFEEERFVPGTFYAG